MKTCSPAVWLYGSVSMEFNSQPSKDLNFYRQPSKASIFTVNRQKLKPIPTVKQFKENLYFSRLLATVLETLEW